MEQVHERAQRLKFVEDGEEVDVSTKPGLHELMQALDILIQEGENGALATAEDEREDEEEHVDNDEQREPISTEVANTVYRLLIKREKQKAYDSLLTLQTEIYDMQGKFLIIVGSRAPQIQLILESN